MLDVWRLLQSIGIEPYVVFGKDDFDEILKNGGNLNRDDYAQFFEYSQEVFCIYRDAGMVRQKGALSSFSIPDMRHGHKIWSQCYGPAGQPRHRYKELRKERQALYVLARNGGCRLVLNYGLDYDSTYGKGSKYIRIKILTKTIASLLKILTEGKVIIGLVEDSEIRSTTMVDDWYMAESITGSLKDGWLPTLFTRHTPTVRFWQNDFDAELKDVLDDNNVSEKDSAGKALQYFQEMASRLPKPS